MLIDNITIKGITYDLVEQSKTALHSCENCEFNNVDDTKTTCKSLKTLCTIPTVINEGGYEKYTYNNYIFTKQQTKHLSTKKECLGKIDCIGYQEFGIKACIICKYKDK